MFKILQKDSSIFSLTIFISLFKIVSHCAEKVEPIWQVTTMKCIAWLLLYTKTKLVKILYERLLLLLWTFFPKYALNVLKSYKRLGKFFVKEHWSKKKKLRKDVNPVWKSWVQKVWAVILNGTVLIGKKGHFKTCMVEKIAIFFMHITLQICKFVTGESSCNRFYFSRDFKETFESKSLPLF